MPSQPPNEQQQPPQAQTQSNEGSQVKKLPKGVVLGPDGKPCRSCTSGAAWMSMMKKTTASSTPTSATATSNLLTSCPPDVEALGQSSWNLLHSITATYPERPTLQQQTDANSFISSFSRLYPCWSCAADFQEWLKNEPPKVSSREDFGRWMCAAHNAVNVKLGKESFDCNKWDERWRTGWKDGSCG